jgi:hypothetical protein
MCSGALRHATKTELTKEAVLQKGDLRATSPMVAGSNPALGTPTSTTEQTNRKGNMWWERKISDYK